MIGRRRGSRAVVAGWVIGLVLGASQVGTAWAFAPSATVSPDRGLRDGSVVAVRGSGFPPSANIEMIECRGTLQDPPKDTTYCDGFTADTTAYSDGTGDVVNAPGDIQGATHGYRIWVLPTPRQVGVSIDCDARHPCVLYVGANFEDFKQPKTFVALNFGGGSHAASGGGRTGKWWLVGAAALAIAGSVVTWWRRRRRAAAF